MLSWLTCYDRMLKKGKEKGKDISTIVYLFNIRDGQLCTYTQGQ